MLVNLCAGYCVVDDRSTVSNQCLSEPFFFLFSEREIGFNLYHVHIGGVLVYMLLHLRVFKACTLCAGLNIAVRSKI